MVDTHHITLSPTESKNTLGIWARFIEAGQQNDNVLGLCADTARSK